MDKGNIHQEGEKPANLLITDSFKSFILELIVYLEGENQNLYKEFLEEEECSEVYKSIYKLIIDLKVATFLIRYNSKEEMKHDMKIFEVLYSIDVGNGLIEKPKFLCEYEYNGKYYIVVTSKTPFCSNPKEFVECLTNPLQYMKKIVVMSRVKEKVKTTLEQKENE